MDKQKNDLNKSKNKYYRVNIIKINQKMALKKSQKKELANS